MCGLEFPDHPDLLVGLDHADDAGVYRITDDIALVQTVDFFTPIVDDPYTFGQIAVANALSDVYAMGGKPLTAMNLVAFPIKKLGVEVLREILRGGLDKLKEAEVTLVGGHSIDDKEPKYGIAVTGVVHPDKITANQGAQAGDVLLLTKPVGTGVVNTALKRKKASTLAVEQVVAAMSTLNRAAAQALSDGGPVHACTDVTGFGLVGHALEMVEGSGVGIELELARVPLFTGALEYATAGLKPGGLQRNREYREALTDIAPGLAPALVDLMFDPQTSGGLLAALPADAADTALELLARAGVGDAARVGRVTDDIPGRVSLV